MELRKKGDLFINLFCMMLSTGIPELRSIDDISYIREALCLGETDQVRFTSSFKPALLLFLNLGCLKEFPEEVSGGSEE